MYVLNLKSYREMKLYFLKCGGSLGYGSIGNLSVYKGKKKKIALHGGIPFSAG